LIHAPLSTTSVLDEAADAVRVDTSSVDAESVAALVLDLVKKKAREN